MQAREEVRWFAEQMEEALKANDHKGGWQNCDIGWLYSRLVDEALELNKEIVEAKRKSLNIERCKRIIKEAADVANFCMIIADVVRSEGDN